MKLIVLINQNLNLTNLQRFSVESNKKSPLKKIFWSIMPLNNKNLFLEYEKAEYRPKKSKNFINLKGYYDLFLKIKSIKKNTYFLNLSQGFIKSSLIEFIMKKKGCIILKKIEWYNYTYNNKNFFKKLSRIYEFGFFFTFRKIFLNIYNLLKNYLSRVISCKPNYYIIENQEKLNELQKKRMNNFIKVNSLMYSEFYKIKSKKSPVDNRAIGK